MAIVNRELDASEQKEVFHFNSGGDVVTGATLTCAIAPYAGEVKAIRVAGVGLSGTPTVAFNILRFNAGAGDTAITGGATTLTITAVGTSGVQSMVLASSGSTLLQVQAGDRFAITSGAANSAVKGLCVTFVVQALQDIKNPFSTNS